MRVFPRTCDYPAAGGAGGKVRWASEHPLPPVGIHVPQGKMLKFYQRCKSKNVIPEESELLHENMRGEISWWGIQNLLKKKVR